MEPVTLALAAFNFLKPLVKAGSEELAKASGKDLWSIIKSLFEKHHKEESLSKMDENTSKDLAEILAKEPGAKRCVEEQFNQLVATGVYQRVTGDNNIVVSHVNNASININQR